ncbi:Acetolactate synthase isozyme 3 large subunit [Kluyvera cryocrescens]|uniref:Acetolactate synthase isozyme 3 large subunit n=1 Tax=Kluyvera cryocrescens TaxID=580 RepID=A0A485APG8_KLUCR|nr:Acetolactate synthase isozyme 3 large subunit [Kluyvera cryocrescens]
MSEMITVGDAIARTLEQYHVEAIYGVISIHNLPIADAVGQRGNIRFVPARGEAGSVTMADAHGRFSGLGVALTSTGAGAGNAVGALVEAMNACHAAAAFDRAGRKGLAGCGYRFYSRNPRSADVPQGQF